MIAKLDELKALTTKENSKVVIDFTASWCGPCQQIAPQYEAWAKEYEGIVTLVKVDVDESEDLPQHYNVNCMPTFIFLHNDEKVDELTGANRDELKKKIEALKARS